MGHVPPCLPVPDQFLQFPDVLARVLLDRVQPAGLRSSFRSTSAHHPQHYILLQRVGPHNVTEKRHFLPGDLAFQGKIGVDTFQD